jgi:hypothetical protein
MLEARPLFTRNINETWQLVSLSVQPTTVPQEYLSSKKKLNTYYKGIGSTMN